MNSSLIGGLGVGNYTSNDDEDEGSGAFQVIEPCFQRRVSLPQQSPAPSNLSSTLDELFTCEAILITDGDADSHNTVAVLRYCRRWILKPRDTVLSLLGYRAWAKDGGSWCGCTNFLNVIYFVLMLSFLSLGPILQYNMCFKRDQGIGEDGLFVFRNMTNFSNLQHKEKCSGNILFVYIIPSIMFLMAYIMSCLVLRFGDSENLQTLLERVYLIASCSPWEFIKHRHLGYMWIAWLVIGITCLSLSLTSMILHMVAAKYIPCSVIIPCNETLKIVFGVVAVCSLWLGDITIVIVVLLYCTQCHLLAMLLCIIKATLLQAAAPLLTIKKQIDESTRFIQHLNRELGLIVGLNLCLIVFRAVTALADLILTIQSYNLFLPSNIDEYGKEHKISWLHLAAMTTNLLCWLLLTILPLVMAAKVSNGFRILQKVGSTLHARPFGYQLTSQQDIDSFLLYVSSLRLKAKILWIPVRTYFLVSSLLLLLMSTVVLGYLYL